MNEPEEVNKSRVSEKLKISNELKILNELKKIRKNTSKIKTHISQLAGWLSFFFIVVGILYLKSCYESITETKDIPKNKYAVSEQEKEILRSQGALEGYQKYLGKLKNKAFAVSGTGRWSYVSGRFKEEDAISDVLLRCNAELDKNEPNCKVINVNNKLLEVSFD